MIRIDNIIFSLDVIEKKFICDLDACHGSCCRYGDSGAPLTEEEVMILDEIWPFVKTFMRSEGIRAVEEQGTSITDFENDRVTPLISNEECAYTYFEGPVYKCAIEKAREEGKISFRKPLSCHLFPVRIKKYSDFTAVNYQQLAICSGAVKRGNKEGMHVYEFLKEPLIRALGEKIYRELCIAANQLLKK
ncbi:MAG TPA: DUF3109 family protein [Bacteroidales bacterium]|nr:DUF3109 family protein [Bacteroidales bacterium]HPF03426.1 DUF3109 family protein [Bacteroidales bacterium]HPJ59946.1 DUF3109 family protein [Bacteroidales bacterium]HPR13089.1 DUF3109 family protein [Bacteroidales bacterium]HRW85709.1 DUF3109 family protein [Bacteroidales bacterium]